MLILASFLVVSLVDHAMKIVLLDVNTAFVKKNVEMCVLLAKKTVLDGKTVYLRQCNTVFAY